MLKTNSINGNQRTKANTVLVTLVLSACIAGSATTPCVFYFATGSHAANANPNRNIEVKNANGSLEFIVDNQLGSCASPKSPAPVHQSGKQ
jgi:hypothetical protein